MSTRNSHLEWALHLADRGWPVFPLRPAAKITTLHGDTTEHPCPRTGMCRDGHQGWEQLATTRADVITAHWTVHPDHNIGLATGPAGLLVVDLDVAKPGKPLPDDCKKWGAIHGAQTLARLAATDRATVPDTWTVTTPSGGTHLYFRQPAGLALRSTRGTDRAGLGGLIDTRGWGGYVVVPGSTLPDGAYELVDDREPAELPGWLVHRLSVRASTVISAPRQMAAGAVNGYVRAAIDGEATRVRTAVSGRHNKAQMVAALALGSLVGGGYLAREDALHFLQQAATAHVTGACGCTERGVTAVFEWGLTAGARNPRCLDIDATTGAAA